MCGISLREREKVRDMVSEGAAKMEVKACSAERAKSKGLEGAPARPMAYKLRAPARRVCVDGRAREKEEEAVTWARAAAVGVPSSGGGGSGDTSAERNRVISTVFHTKNEGEYTCF